MIDDAINALFRTALVGAYRVEQIQLTSPHQTKKAWGDPAEQKWTAKIRFSDGQYGGGSHSEQGDTADEAISNCVAAIKASLTV